VFFDKDEYVVELKVWDGPKAREEALEQLAGYLDARDQRHGYLVSFSDQPTRRPSPPVTFDHAGYRVTEAVITYGRRKAS